MLADWKQFLSDPRVDYFDLDLTRLPLKGLLVGLSLLDSID
jgi:hypothetical protein